MTNGDGSGRPTRPNQSEYVQSLERGLAVIKAFSGQAQTLSLTDVAIATGLTRATARRFLLTLEQLGYVTRSDRYFTLMPRVLELGFAYLSSLPLSRLAEPHMEALVHRVQESSSIAVRDGGEVVYVVRVPIKRIMSISLSVGSRLPAHATSLGRVLLAGLTERDLNRYLETARLDGLTSRTITEPARLREAIAVVRAQGWALVDGELEEGVRSLACPLHDSSGRTVAAINLSVHATRVSLGTVQDRLLPDLQATARAIDGELAELPPVAESALRGAHGAAS
jgi:IclR family pca regulon transcriptional regulator